MYVRAWGALTSTHDDAQRRALDVVEAVDANNDALAAKLGAQVADPVADALLLQALLGHPPSHTGERQWRELP